MLSNTSEKWISNPITEDQLFFDQSLVYLKYDALSVENENLIGKMEKDKPPEHETQKDHHIDKLVGLVDTDQVEVLKSIKSWTQDLAHSIPESASSLGELIKKRKTTQNHLRNILTETRALKKNLPHSLHDPNAVTVPIVVRLTILTIFSLIESLSKIKEFDYLGMCSQTLTLITEMIATVAPLSLRKEPSDCLDAFSTFILTLIKKLEFKISAEEPCHAVVALFGLTIARGGAKNMLQLVDCLFHIHKTQTQTHSPLLTVGGFLERLAAHSKSTEFFSPSLQSNTGSWQFGPGFYFGNEKPVSVATDARYIYICYANQSLIKLGTGFENTVRGYCYLKRIFEKPGTTPSIAIIKNTLYLLSMDSEGENQRVVLSSFNTATLELTQTVKLSQSAKNQVKLLGDGKFLYLFSNPKGQTPAKDSVRQFLDQPDSGALSGPFQSESVDSFYGSDSESEMQADSNSEEQIQFEDRLFEAFQGIFSQTEQRKKSVATQFTLDVYDPSLIATTIELTPLKTIAMTDKSTKLATPATQPLSEATSTQIQASSMFIPSGLSNNTISSHPLPSSYGIFGEISPNRSKINPNEILEPLTAGVNLDKAEYYTNGEIFVCLAPQIPKKGGVEMFTKALTFSMKDGNLLNEIALDPIIQVGSSITYSPCDSQLWCYDHEKNQVMTWMDLSNTAEPESDQMAIEGSRPSSEAIGKETALQPSQVIIELLTHMDRFARQHSIYSKSAIIDPSSLPYARSPHSYFAVDDHPLVFQYLSFCMIHALDLLLKGELINDMAFALITCIRLLKVNLHHALAQPTQLKTEFERVGIKDGGSELLESLKKLLLNLLNTPIKTLSEPTLLKLRQEATNTLTLGFTIFYPQPQQQALLLIELLEASSTPGSGSAMFLNQLTRELSVWPLASSILKEDVHIHGPTTEPNDDESSRISRDEFSRKKPKKPTEAPNFHAVPLLGLLLSRANDEALRKLDLAVGNGPHPSPITSLLVTLQRDILSHNFGEKFLIQYVRMVFEKATQLLQTLLEKPVLFQKQEKGDFLFDIYQDTVIGLLMGALIPYLSQSSIMKKFSVSTQILDAAVALCKAYDAANSKLESCTAATKDYLQGQALDKQHQIVMESEHPYSFSKFQYKQNILVPGAKSILLHFDSRCRTSSPNDVVEITGTGPNETTHHFSGDSFPYAPLLIQGESFNFCFSSNSRADPGHSLQQRWGFKIFAVKARPPDTFQPLIPSWSLDIASSLSWFAAKCGSLLVLGEPLSEIDKRCSCWIDSGLFGGGLEDLAQNFTPLTQWLVAFIEEKDQPVQTFWKWVGSQGARRVFLHTASQKVSDRVERYAFAVMLKHLRLVDEAILFSKLLVEQKSLPPELIFKFTKLAEKTKKLSVWLSQRSQWESRWQETVGDARNEKEPTQQALLGYIKRFKEEGAFDHIADIKHVSSDLSYEEKESILLVKLKEEVKLSPEKCSSIELTARPVIERLKFLLMKVSSAVPPQQPNAFMWDQQDTKAKAQNIATYHSWKTWRFGGVFEGPLQTIISFAQSNESPIRDMEKVLRSHESRARTRLSGFQFLAKLLKVTSHGPSLHQILGFINFQPNHYLFNLAACGHDLGAQVTRAFSELFSETVEIFRQSRFDSLSRSLALRICGVMFEDFDAELFHKTNIFPVLRSLISEEVLDLLPPTPKQVLRLQLQPSTDGPIENDSESESESEIPKMKVIDQPQPTADLVESRSFVSLRSFAWTSFRLLATLCIYWTQRSDTHISDTILKLQSEIFDIMCNELGRLAKQLDTKKQAGSQDEGQCYELLSLMFSLGGSSHRMKSLSGMENVQSLVAMLGTRVAPRSQRLAIRLLRKLLPSQQYTNGLAQLFFSLIGKFIFTGWGQPAKQNSRLDAMEVEASAAPQNQSISSTAGAKADPDYSVVLVRWDSGEKKLADICLTTLGAHFAEGRTSSEAKAKAALVTLATSGSVVLTKGPHGHCKRLAQALATGGGSSTVHLAGPDLEKEPVEAANPNQANQSKWPLFWIDERARSGIVSEYIALLRLLATVPTWRDHIINEALEHIQLIPKMLLSIEHSVEHEAIGPILGSLAFLGSFVETIRVGAQVKVIILGEARKGTVISHGPTYSQVSFAPSLEDPARSIQKVNNKSLTPIPEFFLDPSLLEPSYKSYIPVLVKSVTIPLKEDISFPAQYLFNQIRNASLMVLEQSCKHPIAFKLIIEHQPCPLENLFILSEHAPSIHQTKGFVGQALSLNQQLSDLATSPITMDPHQFQSPMLTLLPHFPFAGKCNSLPTCLETKQAGLIFWGEEKRDVECYNLVVPPSPSSRRGFGAFPSGRKQGEVLVLSNLPISLSVHHYFEVTIREATAAAHISIGFSPEGATHWEFGSYRYQANKMKTWFPSSSKDAKHQSYGMGYKKDDVIGCGWNAETKAIYFTKNKVALAVAWQIAPTPNQKLVPAVALGKGVHLHINFGQEPFQYQLGAELNPSLMAQQKKEAIATHLAEQEEEDKKRANEQNTLMQRRTADATELAGVFDLSLERMLKAMELTSYDGNKEALCAWLLDHPEFTGVKDEPKPKESAKPEPPAADSKTIDQSYKPAQSANFFLTNTCNFKLNPRSKTEGGESLEAQIAPILNDMRTIMLRDARQNYEIENAVMQFTQAVSEGHLNEATRLFEHLCGSPSPSLAAFIQKKTSGPAVLKIEEIQLGQHFQIQNNPNEHASKTAPPIWVREMDQCVDKTGIVKNVNHKSNAALLSIYDPETALLSEWWFPISALVRCDKVEVPDTAPIQELQEEMSEIMLDLCRCYSRNLVMALTQFASFSPQKSSPLFVGNFFQIIPKAYLADSKYEKHPGLLFDQINLNKDSSDVGFVKFSKDLNHFYQSQDPKTQSEFVSLVTTQCLSALDQFIALNKKSIVVEVDRSQLGSTDEVCTPHSKCSIVLFDRATQLPSKSQIGIYYDKQCTKPVHIFTQETLAPFFVTGSQFYHQLLNKSETSSANKYKFSVTPISNDLVLARWGIEFLIQFCAPRITLENISSLFNRLLDSLFQSSAPTVTSECVLILLSHLTSHLRAFIPENDLIKEFSSVKERMGKLTQEMISLYRIETQRPKSLMSSYLQSLIEFLVIFKIQIPSFELNDNSNDELFLMTAVALMRRIEKAEQTIQNNQKKVDPVEDKDKDSQSSQHSASAPPAPESENQASTAQPEEMEEDEDLKEALQLSLSKAKTEVPQPRIKLRPREPEINAPWFDEIKQIAATLLFFSRDQKPTDAFHKKLFSSVATNAIQQLKKESLKERFILIKNIPQVHLPHYNAYRDLLISSLNSLTPLVPDSLSLPKDYARKRTASFCVVEVLSSTGIENVPTWSPTIPPEWLAAEPNKNPKELHPFIKNSEYEIFVKSTLVAKIEQKMEIEEKTQQADAPSKKEDKMAIEPNQNTIAETTTEPPELPEQYELTPKMASAVATIFYRYTTPSSPLFGLTQFNRLKKITCGIEFGALNFEGVAKELSQHIKDSQINKDGTGTEKGLTLEGLNQYYVIQSLKDPFGVLEELIQQGYDARLNPHTFITLEEATEAILSTPPELSAKLDQQLFHYLEELQSEIPNLKSLLLLSPVLIRPIPAGTTMAYQYPDLAAASSSVVRLRFQILKQFNRNLFHALPLLNLVPRGPISKLLLKFKSLIFNSVKMEHIFDVLDKTAVDSLVSQPKVSINRLRLAAENEAKSSRSEDYVKNTSFGIAFDQLRHAQPSAMRQKKPHDTSPHFSLKIDFEGENVQGDGGPYRQFFTDVSKELQGTTNLPLLTKCPNAVAGVGNNQDKFVLRPLSRARSQTRMFKFLGQLMGMAIRTGVLLTLDLTDFFWKPLTGQEPEIQDLKAIDTTTVQNFQKLLDDPEQISLYEPNTPVIFSDNSSKPVVGSNGDIILLTPETKKEWVDSAVNMRLNESKIPLALVRRGLEDIIPSPLIDFCTPEDLKSRVCGKPTIDINLLKRHTQYNGVDPKSPHIIYFWEVLHSFTQSERRAFIQFVWAQERLPANDQEFIRTSTRMLIKPFTGTTDPDRAFPKADTCFFNLSLPEYSSAVILRKQLLYAIHTDSDSMNADAPNADAQIGGGRRSSAFGSFFVSL